MNSHQSSALIPVRRFAQASAWTVEFDLVVVAAGGEGQELGFTRLYGFTVTIASFPYWGAEREAEIRDNWAIN